MSSDAFSQHPLVNRFLSHVKCDLRGIHCQCSDTAEGSEVSLVFTREMAPCHTSVARLSEFLMQNGYIFCDPSYLAQGFIHAKFDNGFNIWADSRDLIEPGQSVVIDFSGELFLNKDAPFLGDESGYENALFERFLQAIAAFDSSLRESREDLVRLFSHAHPWDWSHRQGLLTHQPSWP